MRRSARAFNRFFVLPVAALFTALLAISLYLNLQPVMGDLTRMGGYSENDFGWRADQEHFDRVYSTFGPDYEAPCDVLVVGDSFSLGHQKSSKVDPRRPFWQNYLHQQTGLSIHTISAYELGHLERLLRSPGFQAHPPKVMVFEVAENTLASLYGAAPETLEAAGASPRPRLSRRPQAIAPLPWNRTAELGLLHVDFALTQNYLRKNLSRDWFHHDPTPVLKAQLTRSDLFSHRASDQFLIFNRHAAKLHWKRERLARIAKRLMQLQKRFQANGKTYFMTLVAPDRLTPYEDLLRDPKWRGASKLAWLYETPGLQAPQLDAAMKAAAQAGVVDLYLPNDTHWGSAGHRLAAETVAAHLVDAGVLAR